MGISVLFFLYLLRHGVTMSMMKYIYINMWFGGFDELLVDLGCTCLWLYEHR